MTEITILNHNASYEISISNLTILDYYDENNLTYYNDMPIEPNCFGRKFITDHIVTKIVFMISYITVFCVSVFGNTLVIYVVLKNKNMQTVTNIFITNLAISDLMVCFTSLWLTPVYSYIGHWVFGGGLCYGLPLFQGTSIFISTLTLMAIAVDRYFVICHHSKGNLNIHEHMSMQVCIAIITLIWAISLLLVMPYAVHMRIAQIDPPCDFQLCIEDWAVEELKSCYGLIVMALQFVVPFVIIGYSYTKIWRFLNRRNQKTLLAEKESAYETQRKKRLLRMLITMVVLFAICWLPLNLLNLLRDLKLDSFIGGKLKSFPFLTAHLISMTTTCWNPILYAWLNETFRDEFLRALPFLKKFVRVKGAGSRPRVITDCEPASNRVNCGDHVEGRKSLKTVTSSSTLGTYRDSTMNGRLDHEMFLLSGTNTPTDESPCSDKKRQSYPCSFSTSRNQSYRSNHSNPQSPRPNGISPKNGRTFSFGHVLPSSRLVFWKKPTERKSDTPSPESVESDGLKFVELKSRLI